MDDLKSEYKLQFSTKQGDDILVVHSDTVDDLVLVLEEAKSKVFGHEMSRTAEQLVAKVENHARVCSNCGSEMVHKTGKSSKGEWGGWFCTNGPRGCGANPQWD